MAGVHEWRGQGDASDTRRQKTIPYLVVFVRACLRTELFLGITDKYLASVILFVLILSSRLTLTSSAPRLRPPPSPFHSPLLTLQCAPLLPSSSPSPCLFTLSQLIVPSVVTMVLLYALVVTSFRGRHIPMLGALSMISPLGRTYAFPPPTFSLDPFHRPQNCLWR